MTIVFPCRAFFDSDVLIAGSASSTGAAHLLLSLSEAGLIEGIVSPQVIEECRRNLLAKLPDALPLFNRIVSRCLTIKGPPSHRRLAEAAPQAHFKDAPILAAALQSGARFLVTFNVRDYRPRSPEKIEVLTPKELLQKIRQSF